MIAHREHPSPGVKNVLVDDRDGGVKGFSFNSDESEHDFGSAAIEVTARGLEARIAPNVSPATAWWQR